MNDTPDLDKMRRTSYLEFTLWHQMEQAGICMPFWQRKVNGHKVDFCWPAQRVLVEVQGGTSGTGRARGAHVREPGYGNDRMRANNYQIDGWLVLEFTARHVQGGEAVEMIEKVLRR